MNQYDKAREILAEAEASGQELVLITLTRTPPIFPQVFTTMGNKNTLIVLNHVAVAYLTDGTTTLEVGKKVKAHGNTP
jgi:hypothetical protein